MPDEWADFQTLWEQRFANIAEEHLAGGVSIVPGSRQLELEDGSTLTIEVEQGEEDPPNSCMFNCTIRATYDFRSLDDSELVSETWNSIEEAFGDGVNGSTPLRNRLSSGRYVAATGLDAVTYEDAQETESKSKTLVFTAPLGLNAP